MKLGNLKKLFALSLFTLPLLAGCNGNGLSKGDFEIEFTDTTPVAYINEQYDFSKVLIVSKGIHYDLTATYYNYETKQMTDLPVDNYCFTPVALSDISVSVEAYNTTYIKTRKTSIRVTVKGDPLDELLAVGASKYSDPGTSKQLNIAKEFVHEGNSSILCSFYGSTLYQWGCCILAPNNFRCLNYFSDKTWDNAILTFWVYNPTEYAFDFELRLKYTNGEGIVEVDTDWGNPINVPQTAEPGKWSQLFFSLNKLGVNTPLQQTEDNKHNDSFNIKTKWRGNFGTEENPQTYQWQMYIDGLDVVDASVYPNIDTEKDSSSETVVDGWENLPFDTSETANYGRCKPLYRTNVTRTAEYESKSSLYLTFADTTPAHDIGYSVAFSPEGQKEIDPTFQIPTMNRGTIKADIKFSDDITNKSVSFFIVQKISNDWDVKSVRDIILTDLEDGWYRLYFDFAKVSSFAGFGETIRFAIQFNGVNDSNKANAKVYIDNMFFDQEGTGPAPELPGRGESIYLGYMKTLTTPLAANKAEITIDLKIENDTESDKKHIAIMFFNSSNWDNYFGYYDIYMNTSSSEYPGVTITPGDDGFIRIVFQTWLMTKVVGTKPTTIDSIFLSDKADWTTARGRIDVISATEASVDRGDTFTAGEDYSYFLNSPVAVNSGKTINIEIKSTNSHTKVAVALMLDWSVNDDYFGYFDLGISETYNGVTVTDIGDGYIRYSFNLGQLDKTGGSAPASVNQIYIRGQYTEASGYVYIEVI